MAHGFHLPDGVVLLRGVALADSLALTHDPVVTPTGFSGTPRNAIDVPSLRHPRVPPLRHGQFP
ncbi:hypothetical protein, partial [Actinoplanes sp. TFC3]|uniref:hypothetical protein n=1 Tax=Actinoplanes sp. TFC3 TaxID=1710355 RepID=UPI001F298D3A